MQHHKKYFKKFHFFRWTVAIAIVLVVVFQGYSLISHYNYLSNIFKEMLNDEFNEAVTQYRSATFKQSGVKFKVEYNTNTTKSNSTENDEEEIETVDKYKDLTVDEIFKKMPGFSLSAIPLNINRLDSIYRSKLQNKNILTDYKIVCYKIETDSVLGTTKGNFNIKDKNHTPRYELDIKRTAQAFYNNPALLVVREMLVYFILSGVVLLIVVVLLIYQLKIIAKQKYIEKIRQDFTDSMTHELRNPLQGAIALSEILSQPLFAEDVERRNKGIEKIRYNLQRINGLLNSITQRSYAENLQQTAHWEQGNLPETIQQLIADFKILTNKNVVFETHFEPCDIAYEYDLLHFPNVIKNLIDNAIKYSPNEVTIKVALTHTANNFTVAVSDNGFGIKTDDQPKVFDKFYRVYNKGEKYGFGLGLSYVKWVAELHNGSVEVQSKFGVGTTFKVTIPFNENGKS